MLYNGYKSAPAGDGAGQPFARPVAPANGHLRDPLRCSG
jgi:hypothetical protein